MDAQISSLVNWMNSKINSNNNNNNNILKLIQSENECEGRCVLAIEDVEPNKCLMQIPAELMLNYRFCLTNCDLVDFFKWCKTKDKQLQITRLDAIYFYLLIQHLDENNSQFYEFTQSMPIQYDTPEYYSDELIENYLPFDIKPQISKRLSNFKLKFNQYLTLLNEYSRIFNNNETIKLLNDNFNYNIYKWIFCSVNSRCFHLDESNICTKQEIELGSDLFGCLNELKVKQNKIKNKIKSCEDYESSQELEQLYNNNQCCLIPYIDFLNHSFKSNAIASFDSNTNSYILKSVGLDPNDDDVNDNDLKLVKKNKQVCITYGHHDNKTLLIEYGFILEDNIYDKISLGKNDLNELLNDTETSEQLLWSQACSLHLYIDLSINKAEGPTWQLLKILDLISRLNKQKAKRIRLNYEIKYSNDVRYLFIQILNKYKENYEKSLDKLNSLLVKNYHVDTLIKYCKLQMEIVNFNLELANDDIRFNSLF
jgi:hypothetical protein